MGALFILHIVFGTHALLSARPDSRKLWEALSCGAANLNSLGQRVASATSPAAAPGSKIASSPTHHMNCGRAVVLGSEISYIEPARTRGPVTAMDFILGDIPPRNGDLETITCRNQRRPLVSDLA